MTRLITALTPLLPPMFQVAVLPLPRLKVLKLWNRLPPACLPPVMLVLPVEEPLLTPLMTVLVLPAPVVATMLVCA